MATRKLACAAMLLALVAGIAFADERPTHRTPADLCELRNWLENMVWWHGYSTEEITAAIGLSPSELDAYCRRFAIHPATRPLRPTSAPLVVLPYPGGRHPRRGFLDGAVRPQRETKLSVFAPWQDGGYVVADVPEALWSNLGLTYLAHTHVPTLWTKQRIELPTLEWRCRAGLGLELERTLPNGIAYRAQIFPQQDRVLMELQLTNGTAAPLTDLRVQNCVMLKMASGFEEQTNRNKVFRTPYAAAHSADGKRWVITGWSPCHRAWGNEQCPCLHADPKFPDCAPGESATVRGVLWFYQGTELDAELKRMDATGWALGNR